MQFGSGVLGAEAPVDGGLGSVALGFTRGDGVPQCVVVAVARPQADSGYDAEQRRMGWC